MKEGICKNGGCTAALRTGAENFRGTCDDCEDRRSGPAEPTITARVRLIEPDVVGYSGPPHTTESIPLFDPPPGYRDRYANE